MSNMYAGGLGLEGSDTGNTIWQETGNLRMSGNTMTFSIGNGGEKMCIYSSGAATPSTSLHIKGTSPALTIMGAGENFAKLFPNSN